MRNDNQKEIDMTFAACGIEELDDGTLHGIEELDDGTLHSAR